MFPLDFFIRAPTEKITVFKNFTHVPVTRITCFVVDRFALLRVELGGSLGFPTGVGLPGLLWNFGPALLDDR